ncbi:MULTISPECIES: TetR/AcrR family transcriptional regulator [unclassified Sedimentibacter]|uniref:TetR/AcrR family transcriptional regulator n=1 Tax=unclassified Sedimentibacter TaxID=2649220 RepID=UPI0027E1B3FD|nr:TetR/AcrR family transcriptional regulator [Sedimentibacter sp. MB35-C1]WMJ77514.1 TetR/AcrR family transcriptional regulator [Sedimentibacter sp. MB35-C1]
MSLASNLEIKKISKESIQTALILLLKEKKLDDITINNIVEKAGVSRMAYYRNYKSKEDILMDIFDDFMTKITKISLPYIQTKQWYEYWKVLFDHFAEHVESVRLLFDCNYKIFILNYLNNFYINSIKISSVTERYRIYGLVGMFFNMLVEWIETDMLISSEELAGVCFKLFYDQ